MLKDVDIYYLNQGEPNKTCLLALRGIILGLDENVSETTKYGMPCFCYGKKMFCYLWTDKKTSEPYVLFVEGKYLQHPKLEAGNRARMKIYRVNPNEDIDADELKKLLHRALDMHKTGIVETQ
jgi:hypothetical protein